MPPLELQVSADGRAPGLVRAELGRWLAAQAWPDEDLEDLVFAVSEAVSNAAEHPYRSTGSSEAGSSWSGFGRSVGKGSRRSTGWGGLGI